MRKLLIAAVAVAALGAGAANATTFRDSTGDFLPTFVGSHDADLDITSFAVDFDAAASVFDVAATFVGKIDTQKVGSYVLGIDTGAGAKNFASINNPGVVFDQTASIQKSGAAQIGADTLDSSLDADGHGFSFILPTRFLTSTGFSPQDFQFSLWSKNASSIADFAPNNDTMRAVPEPASWAMMILGFGMVGAMMRIRRRAGSVRLA